MAARQLALPLDPLVQMSREDFLVGPANAEALDLLSRWPDWPAPVVLLIGAAGTGKSHLAQIFGGISGATIIDGERLWAADPLLLAAGPVVVENAATSPEALKALFHLINAVRGAGSCLLVTASREPEDWAAGLPDLNSRLRAAVTLRLGPPDDALLARLIVKLFADRQTLIEPPVVAYLVARMERSFAAAGEVVALMDRLALERNVAPGMRLAAEVLAELSGDLPPLD